MTMISDLPRDMVEGILSRVPLTSMRRVRFTCKRWNAISKDPSFAKMHLRFGKEARHLIMMSNYKVSLMSVNLHGDGDEGDLVDRCPKGIGKLTSLNDSDQVEISKVFHCNGLLLCVTKDKTSLVVWNPYLGQTRWIKPRNAFQKLDLYALGCDKHFKNQKILRFLDHYDRSVQRQIVEYEIFDFKSNSWRVLDVTPDWEIDSYQRGVSLKGNTYFFAREKLFLKQGEILEMENQEDFLICFDFTRESFGPHLPLPFHSYDGDTVSLSSVREEQLAVLYLPETYLVEIWVTNNIEPNVVSWSKLFLAVDMEPLTGPHYVFALEAASFFIDEEKQIAVVFDTDEEGINERVYLIGEKGYYKEVDLGYLFREIGYHQQGDLRKTDTVFPLVCSYSPSSMKIQQGARGKRKVRDYSL